MGKIKQETEYNITKSIKPIYDKALKIAHTDDVTALILGESGTGKEHLANYIHKNSSRKDKPFLTINCSAINDQLLESRIFGYKKEHSPVQIPTRKDCSKRQMAGAFFLMKSVIFPLICSNHY